MKEKTKKRIMAVVALIMIAGLIIGIVLPLGLGTNY